MKWKRLGVDHRSTPCGRCGCRSARCCILHVVWCVYLFTASTSTGTIADQRSAALRLGQEWRAVRLFVLHLFFNDKAIHKDGRNWTVTASSECTEHNGGCVSWMIEAFGIGIFFYIRKDWQSEVMSHLFTAQGPLSSPLNECEITAESSRPAGIRPFGVWAD